MADDVLPAAEGAETLVTKTLDGPLNLYVRLDDSGEAEQRIMDASLGEEFRAIIAVRSLLPRGSAPTAFDTIGELQDANQDHRS